MLRDDAFEKRFGSVNYFSKCGVGAARVDAACPFTVEMLQPHDPGVETSMLEDDLFDVLIEAQGQLTSWMSVHHGDAYQSWNAITRVAKALAEQFVPEPPTTLDFLRRHPVREASITVLVLVAHELEYERFGPPPRFTHMASVLEQGHAILGWRGDPLHGTLVYFSTSLVQSCATCPRHFSVGA